MTESKIKASLVALFVAVGILTSFVIGLTIALIIANTQIKLERQDRLNTECHEEITALGPGGPAPWDPNAPGVCVQFMNHR